MLADRRMEARKVADVAGALLVLSPFEYRRSTRRVSERIAARGGDYALFDQKMDRAWIRTMLEVAPIAGVFSIISGLTGS